DRAPDTALSSRCEANLVAMRVVPLTYAVNPADAERLVHRFRPRECRLAGIPVVVADPHLVLGFVVSVEPLAQLRGRSKEPDLHDPGALYTGTGVESRCVAAFSAQRADVTSRSCANADPRNGTAFTAAVATLALGASRGALPARCVTRIDPVLALTE